MKISIWVTEELGMVVPRFAVAQNWHVRSNETCHELENRQTVVKSTTKGVIVMLTEYSLHSSNFYVH